MYLRFHFVIFLENLVFFSTFFTPDLLKHFRSFHFFKCFEILLEKSEMSIYFESQSDIANLSFEKKMSCLARFISGHHSNEKMSILISLVSRKPSRHMSSCALRHIGLMSSLGRRR